MALVDTDWIIDRGTKVITYTGDDHNGTAPSYATVIQFHRWIQDLADDAEFVGDDELDIIDKTPTDRSTDNIITLKNGYRLATGVTFEHLFDGSIIQGTIGVDQIIFDGIVNYGNSSVVIQVQQDSAVVIDDFWNYSIGGTHTGAADATVLTDSAATFGVADELVGYVIQNTTDLSWAVITAHTNTTITGILRGGTENDWDNTDAYLIAKGLNGDAAAGISHRFMIKTHDFAVDGGDIDGRRMIGTSRVNGYTYSEFKINGTSRGNNVFALVNSVDLNNTTAYATIDALTDVVISQTTSTATVSGVNAVGQNILNVTDGTQFTDGDFIMIAGDQHEYKITAIAVNALTLNRNLEVATTGTEALYDLLVGFTQIDVDNNGTPEDYYVQWDKGAQSINTYFERMKFLSQDGTDHYIYGLPAEMFRGITHEINVDTATGTFDAVEGVTWTAGTGGSIGSGQMFAINSPTAGTKIWIQLITGGLPGDGGTITGDNSGATVDVNVTITERTISTPFVGASTGSALIGSYGLTLETTDLLSTDKVFDLTNTQVTPPNNVTFTVFGLVAGEDRVLVTNDASGIDFTQMATDSAYSGVAETTISVVAIPVDCPSNGTIRIERQHGLYSRHPFSARDTGTNDFTITSFDFSAVGEQVDIGADVFISYIDKLATGTSEAFTIVYNADRTLFVRVRDGGTAGDLEGIKTAETTGSLGSTGGSATVNRISDV